MLNRSFAIIALVITTSIIAACGNTTPYAPVLPPPSIVTTLPELTPELERYKQRIHESLAQNKIITREEISDQQRQIQDIVIRNPSIQAALRDPDGNMMRNEVFQIRQAGPADIPPGQDCTACWRTDIYLFAINSTMTVIISGNDVVASSITPNSQPEIPSELAKIASSIAINTADVIDALGYTPAEREAIMPEIKTSMQATRCERAMHLCVAPTFKTKTRNVLLWAIVDLTDFRVLGIQWTTTGEIPAVEAPPITEKTIQDYVISNTYCQKDTSNKIGPWAFTYRLTSSDGLEIKDITFNDQPIVESIKLVDWHVNYSGDQKFGYSDAVGCPVFSAAAVPSYEPPLIETDPATGEISITQNYRHPIWPNPCSYYYRQQVTLSSDGGITAKAASLGRGCGNHGTYRPIYRIALTKEWKLDWPGHTQEHMQPADQPLPGIVFNDQRRNIVVNATEPEGKESYFYLTRWSKTEGVTDLPTIGTCCETTINQGPDTFVNGETINDAQIVIWYAGAMHNDDTPGAQRCWAEATRDAETGTFKPNVWPCETSIQLTTKK